MDFQVDACGAYEDSAVDDTPAIQSAIDRCSASGGGRVVLPGGRIFSASSIAMKSNVELHLENGAVLKANTAFGNYISQASMKHAEKKPAAAHFANIVWLHAYCQQNISITGQGSIEGNAESVTKRVNQYYVTGNGLARPTLIYFENCANIAIQDVTIGKAPFWTVHLAGCRNVKIQNAQILNALDSANNDGIDLDHCKKALIENCRIECADDGIVLKNTAGNMEYGDCESITVSGCEIVSTSAALKIGTESVADFRYIDFSDCRILRSNRGISLQLRDGGNIENVSFRNISIDTRRFSWQWWGCGEPIAITVLPRKLLAKCGRISNIRLSGISCDSESGILLYARRKGHIKDVVFDKCSLRLSVKSKWFANIYDLRPGFRSGLIKGKGEAFFLHNTGEIATDNVAVRSELP